MGTTVREHFSDPFRYDTFGVITGTYVTRRFPDVPGSLARLKTFSGNGDAWRIGNANNTGSYPLPFPMEAGYDTGWFALTEHNLNSYYHSSGSGSSYIAYWVQG